MLLHAQPASSPLLPYSRPPRALRVGNPVYLALLALSTAVLWLAMAGRADAAACTGTQKRVIIIGAGIAGAAAAQNITAANPCFSVTILEARQRVGGRMFSRNGSVPGLGQVRAEMGGQWIHGYPKNPLVKLAQKYNLTIQSEVDGYIHFSASGRRYTPSQLASAQASYNNLKSGAISFANGRSADISMDGAFKGRNNQNLNQYLTPFVQNQVAIDFDFDYAATNDLSAWYYDSDWFGSTDVLVTNGFDNIPKGLMAEAQAAGAQLVLGFEVTAVSQASGKVTVTGRPVAGGASQSFQADAVLVTVPLGVLKAGSIAFSPALSSSKAGAIQRLGFGAGTKVVLFYQKVFWDTSSDEYGIEDSDLPASRARFPFWKSLAHPEGCNALMGYSVGEYAKRMAGNSAGLVTDAKAKVAVMFVQAANNPVLDSWVQDWQSEPYTRGMYSYAKLGVPGNGDATTDWSTMAAAEGRVFFAGEHTNGQYIGTVHGAYLSGLREAQKILKL